LGTSQKLAIATLNQDDFRYSIREFFVCSLPKHSEHLSERVKKQVIDRVITLEHYTPNKVFVSRNGILPFDAFIT
jgi:hypothetical protein